jgi:hypothetical protein
VHGEVMPDPDRFQRDVARMLLTFFTVAVIDLVVVSLVTHRLRFWFPVWLDPSWDTRPDPWVVYSQSYAAGIFMIPVLLRAVEREFLGHASAGLRRAFWGSGLLVFAFILYWKGGLMLLHGKELEALAWFFLTVIVWSVICVAEVLPGRLHALGQRRLLGGLLTGVACFFLVMSALDPLVQLGVQRVAWSPGLAVEVGFFVPVGVLLLWLSRRLRRDASGREEAIR